MDDREIVSLYWQRDERAIHETAAQYGAYCMRISKNILQDPFRSEENVNDAYMQLWNSIPPHRPQSLTAFLGKITRNLALNKYKAAQAQKRAADNFSVSLEELDVCTPSRIQTEDEVGVAGLSRSISAFLRSQSAPARNVFICRYFYCDSVADIAERFGYSQSKVKSMLMRTRERLRLHLEKEGYYEK